MSARTINSASDVGSVEPALRLISWNTNRRVAPWRWLVRSDADAALLQESIAPPEDVAAAVEVDDGPWSIAGLRSHWRTAIAGLSDRIELRPRRLRPFGKAEEGDLVVSRPGTLSIADVHIRSSGELLTLVSMYGVWEIPRQGDGIPTRLRRTEAYRTLDATVPS